MIQLNISQLGIKQRSLTHSCFVLFISGNPRAEVIWYKENKATREREQIQDNDKYDLNLQDDQRLKADEKWYSVLIQNVQGNDYGDYYCTGTNEFGTRSAKFTLFGKLYIILKNENKIYL